MRSGSPSLNWPLSLTTWRLRPWRRSPCSPWSLRNLRWLTFSPGSSPTWQGSKDHASTKADLKRPVDHLQGFDTTGGITMVMLAWVLSAPKWQPLQSEGPLSYQSFPLSQIRIVTGETRLTSLTMSHVRWQDMETLGRWAIFRTDTGIIFALVPM